MNQQPCFKLIQPQINYPNPTEAQIAQAIKSKSEPINTDENTKDILVSDFSKELNLILFGSQLHESEWLTKPIHIFGYNIHTKQLISKT